MWIITLLFLWVFRWLWWWWNKYLNQYILCASLSAFGLRFPPEFNSITTREKKWDGNYNGIWCILLIFEQPLITSNKVHIQRIFAIVLWQQGTWSHRWAAHASRFVIMVRSSNTYSYWTTTKLLTTKKKFIWW